ncbi:cardiolipin synthetase [Mariniflexile rhizosphaerae]|uniref:phospholipase D-like domain-containing protein n=1 Tax=unclassified Mariniflexile TaxID=2643887 RepID=UPI000CB3EBD1|nr:phospholipase D-like domain-containing protein [Mariniflexile sp. TRM1-10]AXP81402.1 cardiolipin synthetase [Mariniflexile sp. TRM1-10]PLB18498.1 MAG: Phospholipase D/Transphosphatidylase [Flavobacteriaceae bacterium FS1-H7996/R]
MFYNGANCDIYIGKGAGKKLLNDIRNAKKSIKIVSPYLSPFLISELISLRKQNLDVVLITTDNIEDFYGNYERNIHQLIIQNRETDKKAFEKREKWKDVSKILTYITFGLLAILIGISYLFRDIKVAFGLIPIVIIFIIIKFYKNKIKNKRIYSYWYSQLFPFKVYMSPDTTDLSDTFIHAKIYLIDDQIAYLGSLNFTASGTKHNYETRIRTTDPNAIKEIKEELYQLLNHSNLPERDIQYWGKELYKEPIN